MWFHLERLNPQKIRIGSTRLERERERERKRYMLHLILASLPIVGAAFSWPDVTITTNLFVPAILLGVGILWHRGRGPRH